jgi:hypothetical protein
LGAFLLAWASFFGLAALAVFWPLGAPFFFTGLRSLVVSPLSWARETSPSRRLSHGRQTVFGGAGAMLGSGSPRPGPNIFVHGCFRRARWR